MGRIFLMCQYMTGGVFQFPATPLYPKLPEATPHAVNSIYLDLEDL